MQICSTCTSRWYITVAQSEEAVAALLDFTNGSLALSVEYDYDAISIGYFLLQRARDVHTVRFNGSSALRLRYSDCSLIIHEVVDLADLWKKRCLDAKYLQFHTREDL